MRNTKVINFWERCYLLGWIFLNKKQFIKNEAGPYRKYLSFTSIDYPPKLLYRIRDRIIKKECLKDYLNKPPVLDGIMVTWISTQGYIHPHTDTSTHNYHHIRYNLPLILPLRGGKTYYNNKLVETKESHYIKCNTHEEHQTTPIVGFLPRISLSFGFLIHV